ncbi:MAG: FAD-dependent oxidoreductase [Humibacillus sp.]|nr:FAD-dependent oxidoreductase [Humibacillus sp.]MDN5775731.1 FAD-dependent oxidoreductase [Humibacillus sp.]
MDAYSLIVIGSGPGGVSAARAYLSAGGAGPVLLLTADDDPPYQRPPLSKEALRSADAQALTPIDDDLADIEVRLSSPVAAVDLSRRWIRTAAQEIGFDHLVLAPGSHPALLPDLPSEADWHVLRTAADLRRLTTAAGQARTAVVVGSGFIGCEAAASLAIRGLQVTLVSPEIGPQQKRLGDDPSRAITGWLTSLDVRLLLGVEVSGVEAPRRVHLQNGTTLEPDLLLLALGATPSTDFLASSGLVLDEGRICVDRRLETSTRGVYAVGDAALAQHAVAGRAIAVEHWGDAEAMGTVAGRNAAGGSEVWDTVPGFWSEVGEHTLMYAAWGDGWDRLEVVEDGEAFTVWYARNDVLVGVLTHEHEDDYERGRALIAGGASLAAALSSG